MSKIRNQLTKRIKKTLSRLGVILIPILGIGLVLTPTFIISKKHPIQNKSEFKAHWFGQWDYSLTSPQGNLKTSLGVNNKEAKMQVKRGESMISIASPLNQAQIEQQDDYVIYKTANDLINIKYQPLAEGIKEEIILNADPQITTFVSKISLSSVEPRVTADGQIVFVNPEGEYQFHIQPPFAHDAAGDITYDLKYRILEIENEDASAEELNQQQSTYEQTYFNLYKDSDGRNHVNQQLLGGINPAQEGLTLAKDYYLVLEVDPQWIQNPDRQYPITIDPTIVHDESSKFAGQFNRATDTGSGSYPTLETYYQELPADEHTVGLWHLDEVSGASVADASGNGNTGTATGTSVVSGRLDNARSFNGSSDYINFGDKDDFELNKSITAEAWFKTSSADTDAGIIDKMGASNYAYTLSIESGNLIGKITQCSGAEYLNIASSIAVNDDNWHHAAIAFNADNSTLTLYLDGIEIGYDNSPNGTRCTTGTAPLQLGYRYDGVRYLGGFIDEVRISSIARTPEEIKATASRRFYSVYTSEVIDLSNPASSWDSISWDERGVATGDGENLYDDTGLVSQWNFNETSGTTADNAAGSCGASCDGTLYGFDDTTSQDADPHSGWTSNNRRWGGGALQFDGADSYVKSTGITLSSGGSLTISAWVRPTTTDQFDYAKVVHLGVDSTNEHTGFIQVENDMTWDFGIANASGSNTELNSGVPITTDWTFLTMTYDGTDMKVYVNGKLIKTAAKGITLNDASDISIGRNEITSSAQSFTGTIDSTRIYSRALSAHEVMSNYNSANIQFQTRVGDDASPDDGDWEAWSPATSETQILSIDSDASNWSWDNTASNAPVADVDDSTTYFEGTGSLKLTTGVPQVDSNTTALYHFDETSGTGAFIKDSSGNGNDGTPTGITPIKGIVNGAQTFDSGDSISIPSASIPTGNEITISFWAYGDADTLPAGTAIVVDSNGSYYTVNIHLPWSDGVVYWDAGNNGSAWDRISKTADPSDYEGKWTHWAFTKNASSGSMKIYLNGMLWHSVTGKTMAIPISPSPQIGPYYGKLDELKISGIERSAEEISEEFRLGRDHYLNRTISSTDLSGKDSLPFYIAANRPGSYLSATVGESAYANYQPDANTVGLWHLDEESGSGAYIKDASGNGNDGTPAGTTYSEGKVGKAREFNGSSDYIDLGQVPLTGTTYTVEAWFYSADVTQTQTIFAQRNTSTSASIMGQLYITGSNIAFITRNDSGGNSALAQGGTTLTNDTWYHVAGVRNGSNVYVYLNGVLDGADNDAGGTITTDTQNIGRYNTTPSAGGYLEGSIDEVRISNIARTASEIRQAYEVGRRTHPITIDFAASLDSSNLISNTSDTSFTIDATSYGLSDMGSGLYQGDKIIVRETVDGTEYIAQGTVTSVNSSTGAVTISGWDAGSTAPAGGYTANASVFKWQREYWPIADNILSSFMDGITNLTFRVTDGNEGRTIWLDDLKSTGGYLTDNSGSTITSSTGNRYFQYRAIMTSLDEAVSATLSAVTLDYLTDTAPSAPTSLLTEGQTNPVAVIDATPEFSAIYNDADPGDIANKYRIQVDDNADFSSVFWDSGASGTIMSNCTEGNRCSNISYSGSALTSGITYYWRIKFWDDDDVEGAWSTGTNTFSLNGTPNTPSLDSPLDGAIDQIQNPSLKTTATDPDSDFLRYKIELCEVSGMSTNCQTFDQTSSQTGWSGQDAQSSTAYKSGTQATYTIQTALSFNTTYYWRSYAIDPAGTNSWSATQTPVYSFSTEENDIPNIPTLDLPANGAENVISTSPLKTTGTDNDADYLRYKIELCEDLAMTTNCQTFDQTSSQTGWSSQNAQSNTAYNSGTQATYTIQSMLTPNTTYYWRSYAIDPGGMNTWSSTQATPFTFTTSEAPRLASGCRIRESRDDSNLTVIWADTATDEDYYEVERSVNSGGWGDIATGLAANTTSYQDTDISNGNTYRYRVAPYYTGPVYGDWCYTDTLSISTGSLFFNNLRFD